MKVVAVLLMLCSLLFAKKLTATGGSDLAFKQGDHTVGVGMNIPYGGFGLGVVWDMGAINDMFSLGAELTFSVDKQDFLLSHEQKWVRIAPQARFGFHPFAIPALEGKIDVASKLDPYAVFHAGVDIWNYSHDYDVVDGSTVKPNDDSGADFKWGIAVGARYFFTEKFAAWGEVDWDRMLLGATLKF